MHEIKYWKLFCDKHTLEFVPHCALIFAHAWVRTRILMSCRISRVTSLCITRDLSTLEIWNVLQSIALHPWITLMSIAPRILRLLGYEHTSARRWHVIKACRYLSSLIGAIRLQKSFCPLHLFIDLKIFTYLYAGDQFRVTKALRQCHENHKDRAALFATCIDRCLEHTK